MRASHILIKHQGSRRTASWKDVDGVVIKTRTKVGQRMWLHRKRDDRCVRVLLFFCYRCLSVGQRETGRCVSRSVFSLQAGPSTRSRCLWPACLFARLSWLFVPYIASKIVLPCCSLKEHSVCVCVFSDTSSLTPMPGLEVGVAFFSPTPALRRARPL